MRASVPSADTTDAALDLLVRPPGWTNPNPRPPYDLVVVGAGTAGLVSAVGAAGLGARVALVERARLGGDCLNAGCVPSKALLRSARAAADARRAAELGVHVADPHVDFDAVLARMRRRRTTLAPNDSATRLSALGIDLFFGDARCAGPSTMEVNGARLPFSRAIIATGTRAAVPEIPGLADTPYLTNETLFSIASLPARLAIIGAGPIACEMGQAFARFGSQVTIFGRSPQIMPRDDRDAAAVVKRALEADGVRFEMGVAMSRVAHDGAAFRIDYQRDGRSEKIEADALLVAAGRTPNIDSLDLAAAGIDAGPDGVAVNDRLRTSNRRVFAAGDVCSRYRFTHAADAMARIAIQNALFFGRRRVSALVIPWCTYTDPEVAQVGLTAEAAHRDPRAQTITVPLTEVDRSVLDDETDGFVRLHHVKGLIVGCTIVAPHAGEMIGTITAGIMRRARMGDLSATIQPYPTVSEALRKAGDAYRRQALSASVKRWLERYFRWTRKT